MNYKLLKKYKDLFQTIQLLPLVKSFIYSNNNATKHILRFFEHRLLEAKYFNTLYHIIFQTTLEIFRKSRNTLEFQNVKIYKYKIFGAGL